MTDGSSPGARYGRLQDLLDLSISLQGCLHGVSIGDIQERYEISRQTAHRMLRALREAFGEHAFGSETGPDQIKRWRIRRRFAGPLLEWSAGELATLEAAARIAERDGRGGEARVLRDTLARLRALMRPEESRRIDPDLEALIAAQGVGMRAGPRPRTNLEQVETLRQAILGFRKVTIHHRVGVGAKRRQHTTWPLGFLYGNRHYLVGWHPRRAHALLFRLSRIERVRVLEKHFDPPEEFDLRRFAERAFGVFQEDPVDVVWRFRPQVAAEARQYRFHPSQELEEQPDGALRVRFRAGGLLEMAWHLFTWGPSVEVLEPPDLRKRLTRLLSEALAWHRRAPQKKRTATQSRRGKGRQ